MNLSFRFFLISHILFGIIFANTVQADTLVAYKDLQYHSVFEKQAFMKVFKDSIPDYFALYLAADSTITEKNYTDYLSVFRETFNNFRTTRFQKMRGNKKVKTIFKTVHKLLFDKYVETALFSTIFTKKEYQCATGSMFFALIFDSLHIPYNIKKTPTHVFLIAYPKTFATVVEVTNPLQGATIYNDKFKKNYIDYLHNNKLIDDREFNSVPMAQLFEKYYLKSETIDRKQLASTQYHNIGLLALQNQHFKDASRYFEKAYLLDSSQQSSFLVYLSTALVIAQMEVSDSAYADWVAKIVRFLHKGVQPEQVVNTFRDITRQQLEYEGDTALYRKSYQTIYKAIRDSVLRSELAFVYNFSRGQQLERRSAYKMAFPYLKTAYTIKPSNIDAENTFIFLIINSLKSSQQYITPTLLQKIDNYFAEFPQLENNIDLKTMQLTVILKLMRKAYYTNDEKTGTKYRLMLEKTLPADLSEYDRLNTDIAQSYSAAALYYYRKGNSTKTRRVLQQGLQYVPNSYELSSKLKALD